MTTLRHRSAVALTAAAALAIGVIPAAFTTSSILASGEGTTTLESASTSVGTLTLDTTPEYGRVTYGGMSQEFTSGLHCELQPTPGGDDLLAISGSVQTGTTASAGFKNGQIGVFEDQDANSSQCFRVDEGSFTTHEVLTVALSSALTSSFDTRAGSATLKFLKQQSGDLTVFAHFYKGSSEVRGNAGQSVTSRKAEKSGSVFQMNVPVGEGFDRVTLEAQGGSFSLIGPSTFNLISDADALFCNPGNPNGGASTYTEGTTTVNYLGNADSSNSCFGVQLTSGATRFFWYKPLTVSPDAQFTFMQTWSLPTPSTPDFSLPEAFINFELEYPGATAEDDPTPSPDHVLLFCPPFLYNVDGSLTVVTDSQKLAQLKGLDMETDVAGVPGSTDTQFACIDKKSRKTSITDGPNGLKVEDKIFLIGDAAYRFG